MRIEIRPYYDVWYVVRTFGVKACFKMNVNCYDRRDAVDAVKMIVKQRTGHDVISCTTVDPFKAKTRAWKGEIISDRTHEELPPHAY